jgi:copper transport protein
MPLRPGSAAAGRPVRRPALLGLLAALFVVLAMAGLPASAHAVLESSSPSAGSVLDAVPGEVVLTFDEAVRPVPEAIEVLDPNGRRSSRTTAARATSTVRIPLRYGTLRGTYVVRYTVVSDDNHRIAAAFTFAVGAASGTGAVSRDHGSDTGGWPDVVAPILRWLDYTGLALLIGALLAAALNWPLREGRQRVAGLRRTGLIVLALTAIGELGAETLSAAGGHLPSGSDLRNSLSDRSGLAHLSRFVLALVLLAVLGPLTSGARRWAGHRARAWAWVRSGVELLMVALIATYPLAGHPAGTAAPVISVLADGLHVAAMSLWLGGLLVLAAFVLPHASPAELSRVVPLWSAWAGYAVTTVLLTGITQALLQIGSWTQLVETGYGRLVLIKAGLLAVVLLIAAGSRRWVKLSSGTGRSPAVAALRLRVAAESAGILTILAVTSVLVQTTPARGQPGNGTSVVAVRLSGPLAQVHGSLSPGREGLNRIDLHALAPDGRPAQIRAWSATMVRPGGPSVDLRLLAISPDHALSQVRLPQAGSWRITLTVLDQQLRPSTMTTTVALGD